MESNKTIKINELIYKEFEYMLALHQKQEIDLKTILRMIRKASNRPFFGFKIQS